MSLFGNLGGTSSTSNPPKFSFLNPSQSTSQPAPASSLFGGLGSTLPATSASPFGGLGATSTATTSQPAGVSLFGANDSTRGASVFGSLLNSTAPGTTNQSAQSTTQQDSKASVGQRDKNLQPAFFSSLLEKGKQSVHSTNGLGNSFGQLPTLQLNLNDIAGRARELNKRLDEGRSTQGIPATNFSGSTVFG
jgi:hypothetical protein